MNPTRTAARCWWPWNEPIADTAAAAAATITRVLRPATTRSDTARTHAPWMA